MNQKLMDSSNRLQHIIDCIVDQRKLWLGATIIGLLSALFYAFLLKGETWTSRQTMIIRDDLLGEHFKPGSFISKEAMQSAQETVLETARRPEVIRKTLEKLGPETKSLLGLGGSSGWPSESTVEDFRGAVSFESANGGEIGKSEVIVLAAQSSSPERASKFLALLLEEVDEKLSEVQGDRFESMEAELRATCESNLHSRKAIEEELIAMQAEIGPDIGLVRSLIEPSMSTPSAFDEERNQILQEKRIAEQERDMAIMLRDSLRESARKSPDEIPTSAELLTMQPQLADLIAGLAVAKQDLSEQEGTFTSAHTTVISAKNRVKSLRSQILRSLPLAIQGLEGQIKARSEVVSRKELALQEIQDTQTRVSRYCVHYATATQELQKQTSDLSDAKARLARMQSRKMASGSIKLLTRIGEPWTGTRPDGLGKRALALAGGIGGLLIGLGLVMIVAPPYKEPTVDTAAQNLADDEETISEQRLAEQLADVLPTRSPEVAQSAPVPEQPIIPQPAPVAVSQPPVPVPQPQPQATTALQPETLPQVPADSIYSVPAPQPEPVPAPTTYTPSPTQDLAETVSATLSQEATVDASIPAGFGAVSPVDFEPVTPSAQIDRTPTPPAPVQTVETQQMDLPEPRMAAPPTAEQAYLTPTPRTHVETTPQVAPVEYPNPTPPQQPVATTPPSYPTVPDQSQIARPASQTLAAIFANMPQPKTDIGVDDGGSEVEQPVESGASEDLIADRILDVTDQQMSQTKIPEPQVQEQNQASSPTVRETVETIQLGPNIAQSDAIPLQRRASYRPVDLARVEDETETDSEEQPELSERSIDSVFSQLQQPDSRRNAPTKPYDETN